jgi:uncharacterized protein
MYDFEKIRPKIIRICRRLKIKRLDLFGSATGETFGPESDIDVLVAFDRKAGDLFNRYFELKESLEALVGHSVDVVVAESVRNPYFKISIDASRQNIYHAN